MTQRERRLEGVGELTPERLAELRRIAEAATPGPWEVVGLAGYGGPYALRMPHRSGRTWYGVEGIKRREDAEYFVAMNRNTVLALLDEIERLRRERDAALDVLGREDIGDGAKVEGVRLILKGGDRGWPTRESERARLVAEVGECCRGADPLCAAGCLVEAALRQRLIEGNGEEEGGATDGR